MITGLAQPEIKIAIFLLKLTFGQKVKNETMMAIIHAKMGESFDSNQIVEIKNRPTNTKNGSN